MEDHQSISASNCAQNRCSPSPQVSRRLLLKGLLGTAACGNYLLGASSPSCSRREPEPEPVIPRITRNLWKREWNAALQRNGMERKDDEIAWPHLNFDLPGLGQLLSLSHIPNLDGSVSVPLVISNRGLAPSFNTFVEILDGPPELHPNLRDCILCDGTQVTIQPGETVNLELNWIRKRTTGSVIALCYDPLLDPLGFTSLEPGHHHLASRGYTQLS